MFATPVSAGNRTPTISPTDPLAIPSKVAVFMNALQESQRKWAVLMSISSRFHQNKLKPDQQLDCIQNRQTLCNISYAYMRANHYRAPAHLTFADLAV